MSRARGAKAPPTAWDPVPRGWRECPPLGLPVAGPFPGSGRLVPCKAPLSSRYDRVLGSERFRFTPEIAAEMVMAMVASQPGYSGGSLSLVIDLTNTTRYYDPAEFERLGVQHVKIPCRGRGRSPDPLAVNQAAWEIRKCLLNSPETYVLVHCTHGFNRTGYVICAALCRLFASEGIGVDRAVRRFAAARAPGIYKNGYVDDLFWQHHELRPPHVATPAVPLWKTGKAAAGAGGGGGGGGGGGLGAGGGEESDDDDDGNGGGSGGDSDDPDAHVPLSELCGDAPQGAMHHDDVLGEAVPDEEADYVRRLVYVAVVAARDFFATGAPPSEAVFRQQPRFPGSQPVSLDRRNLELVQRRRYLVTWKADGTRYLLLATPWGAYLLDRAFVVRRVQVRFPTLHPPPASSSSRPPAHPVGPPHVFTLLDGEMVVDEEEGPQQQQQQAGGAAGTQQQQQQQPPQPPALRRQRRRYLAYDIMVLNTESVSDLRFADRLRLIEREVERPRTLERQHFAKTDASWRRAAAAAQQSGKPPPPRPFYYAYEDEPFGVRRKDFWPLTAGEKVCRELIPRLCHESDGLILQAAEDGYVPYTCEALLKWKFAHLNSVDFVLRMVEGDGDGGGRRPQLLLKGRPRGGGGRGGGGGGGGGTGAFGVAGASLPGGLTAVEGARVAFPEGQRAEDYDGRVVECSWDRGRACWAFLRERTDKGDPNAFTVFEKVVGSIEDDIREEDVLGAFARAVAREDGPYGEERAALQQQQQQQQQQQRPKPAGVAAAAAAVAAAGAGLAPTAAVAAAAAASPAAKAPPTAPSPRAPTPPAKAQATPAAAGAAKPPPVPPAAAAPPPAEPFVPPRPPTLEELEAAEAEEI